jgi:hypothetical protein
VNHRFVRAVRAFVAAAIVVGALVVIFGPVGARELVVGFVFVIVVAVAAAWWPRRSRSIP